MQTSKVYVIDANINGDYNRNGNPVDHTNEAGEVDFLHAGQKPSCRLETFFLQL